MTLDDCCLDRLAPPMEDHQMQFLDERRRGAGNANERDAVMRARVDS